MIAAATPATRQLIRLREWGSDLLHAVPHTVAAADESTSNMVIRLREWGTERTCTLPGPPFDDCCVATSAECAPRLTDPHASPGPRLTYRRQGWWIQALDKGSGLRQDGIAREEFALDPGVEIGIGPTTLIAESTHAIAVRDFCIRLHGRKRDAGEVDQALRALRLSIHRRAALVLCGEGDLVPIAYALHCRTLGLNAPFVVCDRRRRNGCASVRAPASRGGGVAALKAASGGSLCVRNSVLPQDISGLLARLHEPEPDRPAQLIVCLSDLRAINHLALLTGPVPIRVSPLRERTDELPDIVKDYANEAIVTLRAPPRIFTKADLEWVTEHAARSLAEIEKATLRVVALRVSANSITKAAHLLGMAPISLTKWLKHRLQSPPSLAENIQSHERE